MAGRGFALDFSSMATDVLFVLRGDPDVVASTRERVARYFPYLKNAGISFKTVIPPRRAKVQFYLWPFFYLKIFSYGIFSKVIFVQKDIFILWIWQLFRRLGKKLIYDYDDAVFIDAQKGQYNVFCHTFFPKPASSSVAEMVRTASLVTVANTYLAKFARQHSRNVEVLPMGVDVEKFSTGTKPSKAVLTIGWLGSPQTASFLGIVNDVLERVKARFGDKIQFKFVTRAQVPLKAIPFEQKPWDPATETEDILSFDIGIVPLPKGDHFVEGKSSFKLMQFMAAGLPVVCSAVGYNQEIVSDGQNGFLAEKPDEWVAKLSKLIEDQELRQRMGAAAKATALASFDLKITVSRFLKLLAAPVN